MSIGAILVQHTAWTNAERALEHLRTADAIMLYAADRRTFEIGRLHEAAFHLSRARPDERGPYAEWRRWFEDNLPAADATMFQRYHAYIVLHGKALCCVKPLCAGCPLLARCAFDRETITAQTTDSTSVTIRSLRSSAPS